MIMLIIISTKEAFIGSFAERSVIPVSAWIIALIGISVSSDTPIPSKPEQQPIIKVSALNTCEILRFEAPRARKIPISFVLSKTEICVIIPIIIQETISDIATKAINTYEMPLTIVLREEVNKAT
jgi:hypothetical protein